jgi:hypothetical protein
MRADDERLAEIHERLIAGRPTAAAELFDEAIEPLTRFVISRYRSDRFGWDDVAMDVLFELIDRPEAFDPSKRRLFGYLCMKASGDALNAKQKAIRREKTVCPAVEFDASDGESGASRLQINAAAHRLIMEHWSEIVQDPADAIVLKLWLEEESDTAVYAIALGLDELPVSAQRAEVKKYRDRIEKRLRRLGSRS